MVGIYSAGLNRINEYTPTKLSGGRGGEADLYGRMLVEEIKPFIDNQYRTLRSASETGLGGSSLGGLLTMYLGLKYAGTFGMLEVSSPAFDWDHEMITRCVDSLHRKTHQRIWLTVGTGELERFVSSTRSLHAALVDKGWQEGIDLAQSCAFSDSSADVPMLSSVGHPVATNPTRRLRRIAIENNWPILELGEASSTTFPPFLMTAKAQ